MRVFFLIIFTILCNSVFAQHEVVIPEINWKFTLPDSFENSPAYQSENKSIVHQYKRSAIVDAEGNKIHPRVVIITENVSHGTETIEYAIDRIRFRIIKRFTPKDSVYSVDAACFLGEYNRKHDEKIFKHKTYALFSVDEGKGIQIVLDATESVFDEIKPEFLEILKSFKKIY